MNTNDLHHVAQLLRPVPNFPKPGILFWDIEPVLRNEEAMYNITTDFAHYWADENIDVIAGFDARGFIFGSILAYEMRLPFVQIRKKGKLPGNVVSQTYELEYGEGVLEMIDDGFITGKRVLLIDDLLATGGTALAGVQLVERLGGTVAGFACVTELPFLGGRGKLMHYPVQSLISVIQGALFTELEYCVDMLTSDYTSTVKNPILIQRFTEPLGYAMPGGRIEPRESVHDAAVRELREETGCIAKTVTYIETLTNPLRDPRGVKVSIIVRVDADTSQLRGEEGKTITFESKAEALPPVQAFVFGHGEFLHRI